ncbi:sigma 54-interacting transcriptional regulator [Puia dinghuensis]|nr:sigma 54-interacting transcriptional regulator [Puia dinghuensis]
MPLKILIVEDVFIEADHLSNILVKAGHSVTAIAKSVEQAFNALKKERPDMVMLDIFLKGHLTGIHLAGALAKQGIPFIYLSANSNPSTLEAAKATNPYGFLVKPFREKDILIALDIAAYRHRQAREHLARQERWLATLLSSVIKEVVTRDQKLLLLVKGLQQFIPFDLIVIDRTGIDVGGDSFHCFQRIDLEEYKRVDVPALMKKTQPGLIDAAALMDILRKRYSIQSSLSLSRLIFLSKAPEGFNAEHADLLRSIQGVLETVIGDIRRHARETMPLLTKLEEGIQDHNIRAQGIVGRSSKLLRVLDLVRQVAPVSSTVLISGETGVGKEGVAAAVHRLSDRKDKPLIKINCAAIPALLVESELFGHERGAFTDATDRRIGKFEQAQGGTVFLDEIGELPLSVQGKLLRVLQEKEIERVGGANPVKLDVRVIAATNRDLYDEVAKGRFRMDLYYRIHVFPIVVPALRERKEDIPLLAEHFLQAFALATGKAAKALSATALQQLMDYSWPGNIRELQHLLERHVLSTPSDLIEQIELPENFLPGRSPLPPEGGVSSPPNGKEAIIEALRKCNGKVSGKGGAAELLGINPNTLSTRMRKLGIRWKFIMK